jgi:hypothetical protein
VVQGSTRESDSRTRSKSALAAGGSLAIPVTKTYAFDELPEALGLVGQRSSRGKVAITIT